MGTINFIDNIIIFGEKEAQHNERLSKPLNTLKMCNALLNETKCQYNMTSIKFLGHTLTLNNSTSKQLKNFDFQIIYMNCKAF